MLQSGLWLRCLLISPFLFIHVDMFEANMRRLRVCVMYKRNQKQVRSEINHQIVSAMENVQLLIHVADE